MSRRQSGRGHARKHAGNHKAKHQPHASRKHSQQHQKKPPFVAAQPVLVSVKMKHGGHAKARGWSPGLDVDCCAAEAYGALVTASGRPWSDEQTLSLHRYTAGRGVATIPDTLAAAGAPARSALPCQRERPGWVVQAGAGLILGVALPEPHAIAVLPDGRWWSWGEPFDPDDWPELVIEEAWGVPWL